jgi:hypothetical protein
LGELRLAILEKQRVDDDDDKGWLFLVGRKSVPAKSLEKILPFKGIGEPPPMKRCIPVFCETEDNPCISEEDAEAIRRRFPEKGSKSDFTKLGL